MSSKDFLSKDEIGTLGSSPHQHIESSSPIIKTNTNARDTSETKSSLATSVVADSDVEITADSLDSSAWQQQEIQEQRHHDGGVDDKYRDDDLEHCAVIDDQNKNDAFEAEERSSISCISIATNDQEEAAGDDASYNSVNHQVIIEFDYSNGLQNDIMEQHHHHAPEPALRHNNEVYGDCSPSTDDEYVIVKEESDRQPKTTDNNPDNEPTSSVGIDSGTRRTSSTNKSKSTSNNNINSRTTRVSFAHIKIREYEQTIGDNPCVSSGPPIQLDWQYKPEEVYSLDIYEADRISERRKRHQLLLNFYQRRDLLLLTRKHSMEEIDKATKEINKIKRMRNRTLTLLPLTRVEEVVTNTWGNLNICSDSTKKRKRANCCDKTEDSSHSDAESTSTRHTNPVYMEEVAGGGRTGGILRNAPHYYQEEEETPPYHPVNCGEKPPRDSSYHSSGGSSKHDRSSISFESNHDSNASSSLGSNNNNNNKDSNLYIASDDSKYGTYDVRVDRAQHDKAIEISLGSLKRPHMRAFHSSWISFFVAFFMWFAITPLLSEVEDTLTLTNSQIWTSSLCGTASTIVMRLIMGPLCDKYGARLCMAFILIVAAIPTGLTGLIQTSEALYTIRAFIGIAGASFVACQYWTSCMFTREVAGTANSLVAGWGNLGGGVTQLVMGSALFPLFKVIYDGYDNSAELAWRTVFIIPALLSIITAFLIARYSDDSPKGNYLDRTRTQELLYVNTCESFCSVIQSWNAWILFVQYACCFGVEVTMTNAAALYFKDRFGQSTESAAALASIFGFMNLFARGFGGFFGDMFNSKYGVGGRLWWQFFTLLIQGAGILWFGFSHTLVSAIFALVFASLFVQSAEGSTFGIVPYVNPRFTGGIVGFVGAGGNVGGVAFAVMFRTYNYEKAFATMAVTVMVSSFLSFFVYRKGLAHLPYHHVSDDHRNEDEDEDEYYEGEELLYNFEDATSEVKEEDNR